MSDDAQLTLLPPSALVRASDPETSRAAAFGQTNRATHLRLVLSAYLARDDLTDVEASVACGLERIETTRRASELRNTGLIEPVLDEAGQLVTRRLATTGKLGMVCRITAAGRAALAG